MKHGLKISDDELLDNRKFALVREHLRLAASGFGSSERDKYLETQYWNAPQSAFSNLKICWDYRPIANRLNLEASDNDLRTLSLYECQAEQLFWLLADSQFFQFGKVFQEAEKNLFLRVVGHWEYGTALTPPILKLSRNGKFRKIDGFHRLAVAFAAKVTRIPFWSSLPLSLIRQYRITQLSSQTVETIGQLYAEKN